MLVTEVSEGKKIEISRKKENKALESLLNSRIQDSKKIDISNILAPFKLFYKKYAYNYTTRLDFLNSILKQLSFLGENKISEIESYQKLNNQSEMIDFL